MSSTRHSFSGAAVATTLSSGINSAVTAIPVNALSGTWPNTTTGPFVVTLDRGSSSEEKILVSAYTSTQLTVTRGYDGTTAVSHQNGATVEHTLDATQIDAHDAVVYGVGTQTPSTSEPGDSATDGTATTKPAAGDHKHGREAWYTGTPAALGTAAAGSSGEVADGAHVHPTKGAVIGFNQSAPGGGGTNYTPNSSHLAALDTTNMAVTFTAPPSGNVRVRLTATVLYEGNSPILYWALINGSTKYGPTALVIAMNSTSPPQVTCSVDIEVTGLTSGTSYTFDWAAYQSSATGVEINASDSGGSTVAPPTGSGAPAVMEVVAL